MCVALSCWSGILNRGAGRSGAVTLLGTEFPCLALKGSAKQPSQLPLLHVTHGIHCARWNWKEIFSVNLPFKGCVHPCWSLQGRMWILCCCQSSLRFCRCATSGCHAEIRDTHICLWLVASVFCRCLLKYTSVAVNRLRSFVLQWTKLKQSYHICSCVAEAFLSAGRVPIWSVWINPLQNFTLLCSFGSTSFTRRGVQTPRKMSDKS